MSDVVRISDQFYEQKNGNVDSQKKRERRTTTIHSTPAKGRTEQHMADAPFRGRGSSCCFCTSRALRLRLAVLSETVLDAHASNKNVIKAALRPSCKHHPQSCNETSQSRFKSNPRLEDTLPQACKNNQVPIRVADRFNSITVDNRRVWVILSTRTVVSLLLSKDKADRISKVKAGNTNSWFRVLQVIILTADQNFFSESL